MPRFTEFARENARSSAEEPQFTLQARGLLSLNNAVFRALGQPDYVTLLYDADEKIVALRSVGKDQPNAYKVREQGGSYLVGTQGFISFHNIKLLVAQRFIAHDYGDGIWGFALTEGRPVTNRRGAAQPRPARTDLWRATTDGFEVPSLMRLRDAGAPQPAFAAQHAAHPHTSVRIGALIACEPLGHMLPTSELRQLFVDFLESRAVSNLVSSVSWIEPDSSWQRWAGHGRLNLEAGLVDVTLSEGAPTTWARLLLPEVGMSSFGRDPRYAEIIIHIEPQGPYGGNAKAGSLAQWHKHLTQILSLPGDLGQFLTQSLGLNTADDPPALVGVSLKALQSMFELVDITGLKPLVGSSPCPWYEGWAVADPDGQPPNKIAVELLRQMCDYTLFVDEYEPTLESLVSVLWAGRV